MAGNEEFNTLLANLEACDPELLDSNEKAEAMAKLVEKLYFDKEIGQSRSAEHAEAANGLRAVCQRFSCTACSFSGPSMAMASLGSFLRSCLDGLSPPDRNTTTPSMHFDMGLDESQKNQDGDDSDDDDSDDDDSDDDDSNDIFVIDEDVAPRRRSTEQRQRAQRRTDATSNKAKVLDAALRGGTASAGVNFRNLVEQQMVRRSDTIKRMAYYYNIRHTLTPLKRTLERLSRQMSVKKYNELLRSDLNEIGKAFSLDRQERTYYFHLWKSRTEQRTMDHQDVQHAYKDATSSGVASLLQIGLRIDMEDKMYNHHSCTITKFEIDEKTRQVLYIEAQPINNVEKDSFFPCNENSQDFQGDGTNTIRYECHQSQGQFALPKHISLPVLPIGHTGVGASLPLVTVLMFMYNQNLLEIINGIIHVQFVGDGTQTGRSTQRRWLSTCLVAIVPMGGGILIRSVLNAVVSLAFTATDGRGTWTAHGVAHAIELEESIDEVEKQISFVEKQQITLKVFCPCDGKFLTDIDTIFKDSAWKMNRMFAWTHRAPYNLCRMVVDGTGDPLFDLPAQNNLANFENILRQLKDEQLEGADEVARHYGLDLSTNPGSCPAKRENRFHETMHNTGRASGEGLSAFVVVLSLAGLMNDFENHCHDVVGISIVDGYKVNKENIQKSTFGMRVGLMKALMMHPKLLTMEVKKVNEPLMEVLAQIQLAFQLSRGIFSMYLDRNNAAHANLLEEFEKCVFFYSAQYHRLLALLRGSIAWKPTSLHHLYRYPYWVWYANKYKLDLSCIDSSVIEVLHNFTKSSFRNAGNGGGGNGLRCKIEAEGLGMLEVIIDSMRRVIDGAATRGSRYTAAVKKKLKQMRIKLAIYTANRKMIFELGKGEKRLSPESKKLWQKVFDSTLRGLLQKAEDDDDDVEDIIGMGNLLFVDIDDDSDDDENLFDGELSDDDDDHDHDHDDENDNDNDNNDGNNSASAAQIAATSIAAQIKATEERKAATSRLMLSKLRFISEGKIKSVECVMLFVHSEFLLLHSKFDFYFLFLLFVFFVMFFLKISKTNE